MEREYASSKVGYVDVKQPIIIIDSGLGALEVYKKLKDKYPLEDFIVLMDNQYMPYGTKNEKEVGRRIIKLCKKIKEFNPKMLVIACNTISAMGLDKISSQLNGIEIVEIIRPTAVRAFKASKSKQIALLATINTVRAQSYMYAILGMSSKTQLLAVECPKLASAIENNLEIKATFKEEVSILDDEQFDTIILGCTHYSKIKPLVQKKFTDIQIIDSVEAVVDQVEEQAKNILMKKSGVLGEPRVVVTKECPEIRQNVLKYLEEIEIEVTNII